MECSDDLVEKILGLAKLRMSREEACKAIESIEILLSGLRGLPREDPLYYVWEEPGSPPPEPVRHPRIEVSRLGAVLDEEGRVVLPWRGPGVSDR